MYNWRKCWTKCERLTLTEELAFSFSDGEIRLVGSAGLSVAPSDWACLTTGFLSTFTAWLCVQLVVRLLTSTSWAALFAEFGSREESRQTRLLSSLTFTLLQSICHSSKSNKGAYQRPRHVMSRDQWCMSDLHDYQSLARGQSCFWFFVFFHTFDGQLTSFSKILSVKKGNPPAGNKCLYFCMIFCLLSPTLFGEIRYKNMMLPEVLMPHLANVSLSAAMRLFMIHFCTSGGKRYSDSICTKKKLLAQNHLLSCNTVATCFSPITVLVRRLASKKKAKYLKKNYKKSTFWLTLGQKTTKKSIFQLTSG